MEDCQEGNAISIEDYMKSDQLQLIGYTDSDFVRCINNRKFISGYIFLIARRWWIKSRDHHSYTVTIRAIELYCNSDKSSAKSKHIDIKFLVINDKVQNHILSVDSVVLFLTLQICSLKDFHVKSS